MAERSNALSWNSLTPIGLLVVAAMVLFWPLLAGRAHLVPFHVLAGDPALTGLDSVATRPDWRTYDLAPVTTFYSEKALFAEGLHRGEIPLWNPYNGLGMPLVADGQCQPLAPFFLPFLAQPSPWVYSLCLVFQLLFGGLGMDRLLAGLGGSSLSRTVGALVFSFNPYTLKYLAFSDVWAYAWFPWMFVCAERIAARGRGYAALGVTVALAAMSGHFEAAFMGAAAAFAYLLVRQSAGLRKGCVPWRALLAPCLALLLSAWWLVPFVEWVGLSASPRMIIFRPIPYPLRAPYLWGSELLVLPLLLALATLGATRRRAAIGFVPALAWSLLLLFPFPAVLQSALSLGFMSNRYARSLLWLCVAALAALGLESLLEAAMTRSSWWVGVLVQIGWVACAVWVAGVGANRGASVPGEVPLQGTPAANMVVLWVLVPAGLLCWAAGAARRETPRHLACLGMGACIAGGVLAMPPSTWAAWNSSAPGIAGALSQKPPAGGDRVWLPSLNGFQSLSPNLSALFALRDLRYVAPLSPKRLLPLAEPLRFGFEGFFDVPSPTVLDFCAVGRAWEVAPGVGLVARVAARPLPRGFWVPEGVPASDAKSALAAALEAGSWRDKAFLEGYRSPDRTPAPLPGDPSERGKSAPLVDQCNTTAWQVRCEAPGWFVLRDLAWPGWRAEVDGRPARLYAADGVFRAAAVGAGEHRVTFVYRPLSVLVGSVVSAGTALLLLVFWLVRRRNAERRGRSGDPRGDHADR